MSFQYTMAQDKYFLCKREEWGQTEQGKFRPKQTPAVQAKHPVTPCQHPEDCRGTIWVPAGLVSDARPPPTHTHAPQCHHSSSTRGLHLEPPLFHACSFPQWISQGPGISSISGFPPPLGLYLHSLTQQLLGPPVGIPAPSRMSWPETLSRTLMQVSVTLEVWGIFVCL